MSVSRAIEVFADAEALAVAAADRIIAMARSSMAERGKFTLVLAGGSTPEKTYRLLAEPTRAQQIDWSRTEIYLGDERFVPHDDPRSNYGLARRTLLSQVPVPAEQVFPIPTDTPRTELAAAAYAETLKQRFHAIFPRFDLVLLGMGDDGHTASLFPGAAALHVCDVAVVASPPGVLPPPVDRVTLTFPALNAARHVLFLVAGTSKASALKDIIDNKADVRVRPAAGVLPTNGALTWLVDQAAASLLAR